MEYAHHQTLYINCLPAEQIVLRTWLLGLLLLDNFGLVLIPIEIGQFPVEKRVIHRAFVS